MRNVRPNSDGDESRTLSTQSYEVCAGHKMRMRTMNQLTSSITVADISPSNKSLLRRVDWEVSFFQSSLSGRWCWIKVWRFTQCNNTISNSVLFVIKRGRMPVRTIIPNRYVIFTPLESNLVVVILGDQLPHLLTRGSVAKLINSYTEKICQNDIRLILRQFNNTFREGLVNEDTFPTRNSYDWIQ